MSQFDSLINQLLEKHEMVIARGITRKHQNQIPASIRTKPFLKNYTPKSKRTLATVKNAKQANQLVRQVSPAEVVDMSKKYGFHTPGKGAPTKHLGSTGIAVTKKGPNKYFITK